LITAPTTRPPAASIAVIASRTAGAGVLELFATRTVAATSEDSAAASLLAPRDGASRRTTS
jgi:hypothetical protein